MTGESGFSDADKPKGAGDCLEAVDSGEVGLALRGMEGAQRVEALIAALRDENAMVRRAAAEALGKMGESALEPLIAAFKDGDEHVREMVTLALAQMGPQALSALTRELEKEVKLRLAAEQWATLGKAMAGLAHRINNMMHIIPLALRDVRELLADVSLDEQRRRDIEADLERAERNARFTSEMASILLKPFKVASLQEYDVNELLDKALALADPPPNVKVKRKYAPDLPPILASPLLVDVFVELATNAFKAMPEGGELEVGSRKGPDGRIEVWFSDTGCGIAPENQDKVFDPFFTTNEGSLGFGLWWVKTFLQQQGATIELRSRQGQGTTFVLRLPLKARQAPWG